MQTPLDVASDEGWVVFVTACPIIVFEAAFPNGGTYHLLILPAFVSICQKIHTRALPNEDKLVNLELFLETLIP